MTILPPHAETLNRWRRKLRITCLCYIGLGAIALPASSLQAAEQFLEENGLLVMEAENFMSSDMRSDPRGEWTTGTVVLGDEVGDYVQAPSGSNQPQSWADNAQLSYEISIGTSGTYYVWVRRYYTFGGDNSLFWGIDGTQGSGHDNSYSGFNQWYWVKLGTTSISPGQHSFQLRRRETGARVDRIVLTTDSAYDPAAINGGQGPAESLIDPGITLTSEQIAARFLTQATMGATYQELIDLAAAIEANGELVALEGWIDDQINKTPTKLQDTFHLAGGQYGRHMVEAWFDNAVFGEDQLRQRLGYALGQIFVISRSSAGAYEGQTTYHDMLASHAFGNFENLLYDVSLDPSMGRYLSHLKNQKADPVEGTNPDENYAREIMQLFSIGLFMLDQDGTIQTDGNGDPLPTYTNEQITECAEVFTGLSFPAEKPYQGFDNSPSNFIDPMFMYDEYHDLSEKVLLDHANATNNGIIPAWTDDPNVEQEGLNDVAFAVNNLFTHPNVGPFIGRLLIQQLVTSNPTNGYVSDVAAAFADDGFGNRGNMTAVFKEILLHPEARNASMLSDDEHGKLNDAVLRLVQVMRNFDVYDLGGRAVIKVHPSGIDDDIGMAPLHAPSVFNFFLPDFQPPGQILERGLVAPEFELHTDTWAIKIPNTFKLGSEEADFLTFSEVALDFTAWETFLSNNDDEALIDRLDLVLCRGLMTDVTRNAISDAIADLSSPVEKVQLGFYLAVFAPEFNILR